MKEVYGALDCSLYYNIKDTLPFSFKITDRAAELETELRNFGFERYVNPPSIKPAVVWAKFTNDYKEELKTLEGMGFKVKNRIDKYLLLAWEEKELYNKMSDEEKNCIKNNIQKPKKPSVLGGEKDYWNHKIYGYGYNKVIYVNGEKISLTKTDEQSIYDYLKAEKEYAHTLFIASHYL